MPKIEDDDLPIENRGLALKKQVANSNSDKKQFSMQIETAVSVDAGQVIWKPKQIHVELGKMVFELDALQQELLNRYLRQDVNFLKAFYSNYTELFMQFLRDKARLNEPITLSIMGQTRSGKSTSGITVAGLLMESRGKLMDANHIVSDQFKFMSALKDEKITHFGDCFVIDESKDAVFGVGSQAKKFKLGDIQNIIAVNNISTVWIRPDGWSFEQAQYGLRAFGRGQFYRDGSKAPCRLNRFMLYNLQESSSGGSLPLGMIYLPHFSDILKNGEQLWKDYSEKKQAWVNAEQKGESDSLMNDLFAIAEKIHNYPKFKLLKGANQKKTFIQTAMGSEVTKGEISTIYEMIKLLENGFNLEEIKKMQRAG